MKRLLCSLRYTQVYTQWGHSATIFPAAATCVLHVVTTMQSRYAGIQTERIFVSKYAHFSSELTMRWCLQICGKYFCCCLQMNNLN